MSLADLVLKAKINLALARDPRVSALDIGVHVEEGWVRLTGDADSMEACAAAAEIARAVDGVSAVTSEMTCGLGAAADSAERVRQRFLEKLEDEWNALPDQRSLTQADYLRWALWMVYKFRIPDALRGEDGERMEADTVDEALGRIASLTGAPRALVALEMLRQAESVETSRERDAPAIENAPLTASPTADAEEPLAA